MGLAEERQQVVLAEAIDLDVADQHHLVVLDLEERLADDVSRVQAVPLGEYLQTLPHSCWRIDQAIAGRIFPNADQQVAGRRLEQDAIQVGERLGTADRRQVDSGELDVRPVRTRPAGRVSRH